MTSRLNFQICWRCYRQPVNTIEVIGVNGNKIVLLVIPPPPPPPNSKHARTHPDYAYDTMTAAAAPENAPTIERLPVTRAQH
jgi:hypothetical protein